MDACDSYVQLAAQIGDEHGYDAGDWALGFHHRDDPCRRLVQMFDEGDPQLQDQYRVPDLGDEDGYSVDDLLHDVGASPDSPPEVIGRIVLAYLNSVNVAFWDQVEWRARKCVADYHSAAQRR